MARVIEVKLAELIPNFEWVYEVNLQQARDRWDQNKFETGVWIYVFELDGRYFLPDWDHRTYVSYFEKNHRIARATLVEEQDYNGRLGNSNRKLTAWQADIENYRRYRNMTFAAGVNSLIDLEHRVKPGSWQEEIKKLGSIKE